MINAVVLLVKKNRQIDEWNKTRMAETNSHSLVVFGKRAKVMNRTWPFQ